MKKSLLILLSGVLLIVGCSKDGDVKTMRLTVNVSEKKMKREDTFQIEAKSDHKISYFSGNTFVATVSELGLVEARHVGDAEILVSDGADQKKVSIVVEPRHNLYPEPIQYLGKTKEDILRKFGQPDSRGDNSDIFIYYSYSENSEAVGFAFKEGKVEMASVVVSVKRSTELATFLIERYNYVGRDGDYFEFVNSDDHKTATLKLLQTLLSTGDWVVGYYRGQAFGRAGYRLFKENDAALKSLINSKM